MIDPATWGDPIAQHGDAPGQVLAMLVKQSAAAFLDLEQQLVREHGLAPDVVAAKLKPLWALHLQQLVEQVPVMLADMALTATDAATTAWH